MTNRFTNLDKVLCDKLLNFIYPDESNMTDEEIQAELQRLKIDMRPAIEKLNMALNFCNEKQKAQAKRGLTSTLQAQIQKGKGHFRE
ncbi:unnamed protein product [marine sediment metagenome]|uniref:Uncharacterized protein n=1 Tax=marine sediment metagenome TaxID=412755 RepID=X1S6P5_9ZZZZ